MEHHAAGRAADPDAATMRRVGWRLAALTVGLLCALLLVLGVVVYLVTQQALLGALEQSLQVHARNPSGYIKALLVTDGHVQPGRGPRPDFGRARDGVYYTAIDPKLTVLGGAGPSGPPLFDRAGAQEALRSGSFCCTYRSDSQQDYLIYSQEVAIRTPDSQVPGVVQTGISAQQYEASMQALLRVLLLVSVLGLLASGAISAVLAQRALRPIQVALRRQRDFVADAAHELRTPLAIQRTATELGLASGSSLDQQTAMEQGLVQNAHLTRLVDALSLLARADSGVLTLERQPVDLAGLTAETAEGVEVLAEEREVCLHVQAATETPLLGDAGRLRQLVLILLDNALKFTPVGGAITVRVERQGNRAQLQVRDSGPGIDPHDLPHVFDRFYRADRARSGEGTGLGLAIGRWIAEAHGGSITAANAPDHGAVFTVTLPLGR